VLSKLKKMIITNLNINQKYCKKNNNKESKEFNENYLMKVKYQ
jgi:hypothetical protein